MPKKQIINSSHDSVLPLSAPTNTVSYDIKYHEKKPEVIFDKPVYSRFDILVKLNKNLSDQDWQAIVEGIKNKQ